MPIEYLKTLTSVYKPKSVPVSQEQNTLIYYKPKLKAIPPHFKQ